MRGVSITTSGSFDMTEKMLKHLERDDIFSFLDKFGREGVDALSAATPTDSAESASSWYYEIKKDNKSYSIIWGNNKVVDGTPVVILLQYGHATRNGGFVQGEDFINPALKPVFARIKAEFFREVTKR